MIVHEAEHVRTLHSVCLDDAGDVQVDIVLSKIPAQYPLAQDIRVKVRRLLGSDRLVDDLPACAQPAESYSRRNDL